MKDFIRFKDGQKLRFINIRKITEVCIENKPVIGDDGQIMKAYVRVYFEGHRHEDSIELTGEQAKLMMAFIDNMANNLQDEDSARFLI